MKEALASLTPVSGFVVKACGVVSFPSSGLGNYIHRMDKVEDLGVGCDLRFVV